MGKFKNLTKQRFGRLTVIERTEDYVSPKGHKMPQWLCQCDCGKKIVLTSNCLNRKKPQVSCGCYQKEVVAETSKYNNYHKKYNHWTLNMNSNIAVGEDSKGQKFIVDAEDWVRCKDIYWYTHRNHMVTSNYDNVTKKVKVIPLHRFLMNPPDDMVVDHINGNPFNNRKSNLRVCTQLQNAMNHKVSSNNTSGVTGVFYNKNNSKWIASIQCSRQSIYLGSYKNIEDAIKARKEAEQKYFGEFARVGETP